MITAISAIYLKYYTFFMRKICLFIGMKWKNGMCIKVHYFPSTTITKYHKLGGLNNKIYCLTFLFVLINYQFYTHWCIYVNHNLPIHPTTTTPHPPCFPTLVSISLFSASVSLFLHCKPVHLYHFSRFHI